MLPSRRRFIQSTGTAALLAGLGRPAGSQVLDSIRVVVGFAPGGTADAVARRVADALQAGRAVVDNKTGIGGQIAVSLVKTAAPDGATVLLTPMSMLGIYPHTYKKLPYDPVADLMPVSGAARFDYGFAVGDLVPATVTTLPEFLAWAKANPSRATFGSPAAGSAAHFMGALLGRAAGVTLRQVPFRGTQPAMLDLVGGRLAAVCGPTGEFTDHVAAGDCRLLATSGAKRNLFTPSVPTLVEQGYKDLAFSEWFGFFLPANTPQDVVQRLNSGIRAALALPAVVNDLAVSQLEAWPTSPAQLAGQLRADTDTWAALVKALGFAPEA